MGQSKEKKSKEKAKDSSTYKNPRKKNYFQSDKNYNTVVSAAKPGQGSATVVGDRKDDDFIDQTNKLLDSLIINESQTETTTLNKGWWQKYKRTRKAQPYEASHEEYNKIVKKIGHKMWMTWPSTTDFKGKQSDGPSSEFLDALPDLADTKPPYRKEDDPNLEYQWEYK